MYADRHIQTTRSGRHLVEIGLCQEDLSFVSGDAEQQRRCTEHRVDVLVHERADRGRQDSSPVDGRSERRQIAMRHARHLGVDQGLGRQRLEAVDVFSGLVSSRRRRRRSRAVDDGGQTTRVAQWVRRYTPAAQRRTALNYRPLK